jgi:hypothetical protein
MGREPELSAAPRYVEDPSTCYFYHSMELPGFGLQRGEWDLRGRFDEYIGHVDLAGARVVDEGCASGFEFARVTYQPHPVVGHSRGVFHAYER